MAFKTNNMGISFKCNDALLSCGATWAMKLSQLAKQKEKTVNKGKGYDNSPCRLNCNLFRAIRYKYLGYMIRYCNAWGWKYLVTDTLRRH